MQPKADNEKLKREAQYT